MSVSRRDIDDAHHSLRLVFQDVAMKHATAWGIDAQANTNLLTGGQIHGVHERIQPRIG